MDELSLEIRARLVEGARQAWVERYGSLTKHSSRKAIAHWLDFYNDAPIKTVVRQAAAKEAIDTPELIREAEASIKFRVLAGMIHMPIGYAPVPWGGICGRQEYDPDTGGWPCKVPSNQAQADEWHNAFGNSPACPFWQNPAEEFEKGTDKTQLDHLMSEGNDIEEAWKKLKLVSPSEKSG